MGGTFLETFALAFFGLASLRAWWGVWRFACYLERACFIELEIHVMTGLAMNLMMNTICNDAFPLGLAMEQRFIFLSQIFSIYPRAEPFSLCCEFDCFCACRSVGGEKDRRHKYPNIEQFFLLISNMVISAMENIYVNAESHDVVALLFLPLLLSILLSFEEFSIPR